MSAHGEDEDDEVCREIGSVFMMGFNGPVVTPQIRQLIEKDRLGTIMLSAKNLRSAEQATKLISDLQRIAHKAGHKHPLLIAIDNEGGGLNNIVDPRYITLFPGAMGLAATGSTKMCYEVALAMAKEVSAVGVNWILGPVMDVLNISSRTQPLGVRTMGSDPQEVSQLGVSYMKGLKDGGVFCSLKHFPSYGNLEFLGSPLDVPIVSETVEQLHQHGLIPFKAGIRNGADSVMVGGCSMSGLGTKVMHACLSEVVVNQLLRRDLQFDGVICSDCLEIEALHENIGVGQATVMALCAGCDVIIVCRSFSLQQEAISGIKSAMDSGLISREQLSKAAQRVNKLKESHLTWEQALNPPGVDGLSILEPSHKELSRKAYQASITLVRDNARLLPISNLLGPEDEILLLSPLVKPLPASLLAQAELHATLASKEAKQDQSGTPSSGTPGPDSKPSQIGHFLHEKDRAVMTGESVFRELGRAIARENGTRVLHTSYTANGIRPVHENLIERASLIIVITADANGNRYQYGFTKHVAMMCSAPSEAFPRGKPVLVVSVSSPYDFAADQTIKSYICTYDFTEPAIEALVKVLYGREQARGTLPGTIFRTQKQAQPRQHWLVESWNKGRDLVSLQALLKIVNRNTEADQYTELLKMAAPAFIYEDEDPDAPIEQKNFVVRNSSTRALYGFVATYFNKTTNVGSIGIVLVDPTRRNLSIGHSLHNRAMKYLLQKKAVQKITLGSRFPSYFMGAPVGISMNSNFSVDSDGITDLTRWCTSVGWSTKCAYAVYRVLLPSLSSWTPPMVLSKSLSETATTFELISSMKSTTAKPLTDEILALVASLDEGRYLDAYKIAVADLEIGASRILAALDSSKKVVGAVILAWSTSGGAGKTEKYLPWIHLAVNGTSGRTGGIAYPVMTPSQNRNTIYQGLVALAVRQFQMQQQQQQQQRTGHIFDRCVLDCVDGLSDLETIFSLGGWEIWHSFQEYQNDAATARAANGSEV